MERRFNVKFNTMKVSDFGLKLLGGGLFVNRGYAESRPELIAKLLRAIEKGYRQAGRDRAAAAAALYKHLKTKVPEDILQEQLRVTMEDMNLKSDKPLGWQDDEAWRTNVELLHRVGVMKTIGDIGIYYTNRYYPGGGVFPN
jgi:ABC-type nitrate/sulfonate/bicarbonate transport system substrate-binding protein